MKLVIGLVGEKGSGKETFAKFLKEVVKKSSIAHVRFSDVMKETLISWGIPVTRENLQKIAQTMERDFGKGTVANSLFLRIHKLKEKIIIIDGMRWKSDVELLEKFPGSILVYITTDLKLRFERLKKRGEKTGEESTSFKQFLKEEKAKNEVLIPKIGKNADFKIENNGSLSELRNEVLDFAEKINVSYIS